MTAAPIEQLEQRWALAIDVFQFPFGDKVLSGAKNYAVLIQDQGSSGYLKKNATPSPTLTFADNSQFLNTGTSKALPIAELPAAFGQLTTIYATSGSTVLGPGTIPGPARPGPSVTFTGLSVGTSNGIIPGTFSGTLAVTDNGGNSGTIAVLSAPENGVATLRCELLSGDCALPTRASIDQINGAVTVGWDAAPLRVSLTPLKWAIYDAGPAPISMTLMPGLTPQQRLWVDFTLVSGSSASIESPIASKLGEADIKVDGMFAGAGGVVASGQLVLDATNVSLKANASSTSVFAAHAAVARVDRPVAALWHSISVTGSAAAPGLLLVGEQGALANDLTSPATKAADNLSITASQADVVLAGTVNATDQTFLLNSENDPRPYTLTTVSPQSGIQTGLVKGGTVGVTLGNNAGGEVSLQTAITELRMTAASTPSVPVLPYAIQISDADDLVVDAVPASQRAISLTAAGQLFLNSNIATSGSLALSAAKLLSLSGPISTASGDVSLTSDSITTNGTVFAGGVRGVTLVSRTKDGDVTTNAAVRAGGPVLAPVAAATTADVDLGTGGLLTIDGVALSDGDRVLVKNQIDPRENGVYVAAAGAWQRSADTDTSLELQPGFTVYALNGTQEGGWVFANPANPTLGQTGMAFVAASATQTWAPVTAATTGAIALSGPQTIDGVSVAVGDRVLVKNQSNARQNGIYVVATGAWQRAGDANTAGELVAGSYVFVNGGTTNGQQAFVLQADVAQVGTTPLTFDPFLVQATRTNLYSPANVIASVAVATTVGIDLATGGLLTIDGVELGAGDRVLVKNQTDAAQNGIYTASVGAWTRASDADSAAELARGSSVYVIGGAQGGGTNWTFNDATYRLANTTAGSQSITGLLSTTGITPGMLVSGPGIPAGTTVLSVSTTSLLLSQLATATGSAVTLGFVSTAPVAIDTTSITLVPSGGTIVAKAGRSITSTVAASPTSRLQASVAILTAGRPVVGAPDATSSIVANTAVGRLTATAPGSITIDNSASVSLDGVQSLTAGTITVTAAGTISAPAVSAAGLPTNPVSVTLTALTGDVVAAGVGSTLGDIRLTAQSGDVIVKQIGASQANVIAQAGTVRIQATRPTGAATGGDIRIDGRVSAAGSTSNVFFLTDKGRLTLTSNAVVTAADQLRVSTPSQMPVVDPAAQLAGGRLFYRAPMGPSTALPPAFANNTVMNVKRTDEGDIDISSASALTVEGATVIKGSVAFTAPTLRIIGPILAAGSDTDISLRATSGDLAIAPSGSISAPRDITLAAPLGGIAGLGGAVPLLTAGNKLTLTATTAVPLTTKVASLFATLTKAGATLSVTEFDDLVVGAVSLAAGSTVSIVAGSAANPGTITVTRLDAGPTGKVTLVAQGSILDDADPTADIIADTLQLTATTGRIDLDTDVNVLTATALQKNQTITIDDLGTGTSAGLELRAVKANGAAINVSASGDIVATSVETTADVSLTSATNILVGSILAPDKSVTLTALNSIREATPADPTADISAASVILTATTGSIDVQVAATALAAQATAAGSTIRVVADGDLRIGVGSDGIAGDAVTVRVAGGLSQSQPITANSLDVTSTGGDVNLAGVTNDVNLLNVSNGSRVVAFKDADDLVLGTIAGGAVSLTTGGPLSQTPTGAVSARSLAVVTTSGDVTLTNATNNTDQLSIIAGGSAKFVDANGFTVGVGGSGVSAGTIAAGDGDAVLTATTGSIVLAADVTAENDTVRLKAPGGTITQTAGQIRGAALVWTAQTAPTFLPGGTAVSSVGLNLSSPGNLRIPLAGSQPGTLTIASATTVDGDVTIDAGAVVITGLVRAGGANRSVGVTARTAGITMQNAGRIEALGSVSLTALGGGIAAVTAKGGSITATAAGDVTVARMEATGPIQVSTPGNLVVGPVANALLQGQQQVDLRQVAGNVEVQNSGRIIGNPVLLSKPIVNNNTPPLVWSVGSESELVNAINAINIGRPANYEVTLTSSFTLTQTLFIQNRVVLRGASPSIWISGSSTATNGLVLGSAAAGSQVTGLNFTGFSGTAISLNNATNVSISGLNIERSGTGLAVSGGSSGTTVRGNRFTSNSVAIRLTDATSLTIGGTAAGQSNRITSSSQTGVLATGFCTGTQIIKTVFATTPKPYSVQGARNLRIVN